MGILLFQISRVLGGSLPWKWLCALFAPTAALTLTFPAQSKALGIFSSPVLNGLGAGTNPEGVAVDSLTKLKAPNGGPNAHVAQKQLLDSDTLQCP